MSDQLDDLLTRAAEADGLSRIEYRDAIAAHGQEAVRRLEPWLQDRLAAFAVVTIAAATSYGAVAEARTTLLRARPISDPRGG